MNTLGNIDYMMGYNCCLFNGRGGLGYKPYNKPTIIGGMPIRDIKNPNKLLYEHYNPQVGELEMLEDVPQLIATESEHTPEEFKYRLFNELEELVDEAKQGMFERNDDLNDRVASDFNQIKAKIKNLQNYNSDDKIKIKELSKRIQDIFNLEKEELKQHNIDLVVKPSENKFYDKMVVLGENRANDVRNNYINGTQQEKDKIIKDWFGNYPPPQFTNLKTDAERGDHLFKYVKELEKGNESEDKLIDKEILLTFIDKDNSQIYDSKDERAYNPIFIAELKKLGVKQDEIDKVLKTANFDALKDNTIWELKAFGKKSFDPNYKDEKYSKAKFYGSEPFVIIGDKWYKMRYQYFIDESNEKIRNIGYQIREMPYKDKNKPFQDLKLVSNGMLLKPNPQGYNYYILENTKDRIQYTNALAKDTFKEITNFFTNNPSKKMVNIPNAKFLKLPPQYVERYEATRLKKNIRKDKSNMFKNWIKHKTSN